MDMIAQLGSLLGLSFISGINLYATVAVTGLCVRTGLIEGLPPQFQVFGNEAVIFIALLLYFVEFFMDKIQGLDTLWDSLHTVIRPLGGALIALMQLGEATPAVEVIVFMLGASMASAAHFTKAGTRLLVNASPEPVSNVLVSIGEDIGVVGYSYLALAYPKLTFFLTLICIVLIFFFLPLLFRTIRMLFGSLFFRLKSLFTADINKSVLLSLPLSRDAFLEDKKGKDEQVVWSVSAYAGRIPSVSRSARVHLVLTSKALYCLYKRRFRLRARRLSRSEIEYEKCYPGRLLAKWLIRTSDETWVAQIYQPLAVTLPEDLSSAGETGNDQTGYENSVRQGHDVVGEDSRAGG